ncbi:TPA: 5-deoxy-glucuronate isomerase [bacterium]|nr:5-deoxy-glucuronate isomerase [bacterium]
MNFLLEYKPVNGYTELVKRGESGLSLITFGILKLDSGKSFAENSGDDEVALIILSGKCDVRANESHYASIGERTNVFAGKAYGIYIPPDTDYVITAYEPIEIAICKTPGDHNLKSNPILVTPDQVVIRNVGQHNWNRKVHDIIDMRIKASKIVVGETFTPPGNWSSYPPHRHDFDNLPEESDQEELYFFKIEPQQGFGIQRIYTDDMSINEAYIINNNSVVAIPKGYHPVSAAPGYQVYYLWILAGEKRILRPKDDPNHKWIKACEPILAGL